MTLRITNRAAAVALTLLLVGGATAARAQHLTLRFGILAGLTGDPAPSGQAWNESAKLAIEHVRATLARMNITDFQVVLADSQDSQGSPKSGVEGAQKLVQIDKVQVVIGDFYSSVTSAVATSVDRKSTRLNSSHVSESRMPSSA